MGTPRRIPEPPKTQIEYIQEWVDWLEDEIYLMLGPEGDSYSEEPLVVYGNLQKILKDVVQEYDPVPK
jgi:hypothetical protein